MMPSPEHASQRPPFTLKLKRPFLYPRALASFVIANRSRIWSNTPVYVAGFERGVRPIGDWSIAMILSSCSIPWIFLCFPALILARFRSLASCLYRMLFTRELLPEPETPVTQVITPSGIWTLIFFRLFSCAPITFKNPVGFRRTSGTGILIRPLKYAPVTDSSVFMISSGVPCATTSPPCSPAPGPISTIWSAASIVSSSCSTTRSEFPISARFFRLLINLSLSRWWRPILGSSKI